MLVELNGLINTNGDEMKVREYLKERGMVSTAGGDEYENPEILDAEIVKNQVQFDIDLLWLADGSVITVWYPTDDIYGEDSDYPMTEARI